VTPIAEPRELFLHQLRTMLWLERQLADDVLPALLDSVHAADLRWAVERHLDETKLHAANVRYVLDVLGADDGSEERLALTGLKAAHDFLMERIDTTRADVADLFHLDVIVRTEHMEIAAYTWLVHAADALDVAPEATRLLRRNMGQEEYALEEAEKALVKLLAERVEAARVA
jgi:ferritin-like metal-binding protein YciE